MSSIVEEIDSYLGCGSMSDEEYLAHYGMPRRSGRYPWGSGKEPFQSSRDFLGRVDQMRKNGFTYVDPQTGIKYTGDNAIAKSKGGLRKLIGKKKVNPDGYMVLYEKDFS